MRLALVMSHADRSLNGAVRELHFCKALKGLGWEVEIFRMHAGPDIEHETYMDSVTATFCPVNEPGPIPHHLTSNPLYEAVKAFRPDLILYKGLNYRINQFINNRMGNRCPFGFIVGGDIKDPILDQASVIFAEYPEQMAAHFQTQADAGRAVVMPKYIDADLCFSTPAPRRTFDLINVGNFYEKRKNQRDLLPFSAKRTIALVGAGTPAPEFWDGVPDRSKVTLLGKLDRAGVYRALQRAKVMFHTSTMDGLPRSIIEGMACGTPVVAYRDTIAGGFIDGVHGFLVTPETAEAAVDRLLDDAALRRKFSVAARKHALLNHGPDAIRRSAEAFTRLFKQTRGLRAPMPEASQRLSA